MEMPAWLSKAEEFTKTDKPLNRYKHLTPLKKLHKNLEAYQELLIELITTVRAMKVAIAKKIERLEDYGY